jgi:geranylgeranyl diphosphate synthase, type I
MAPAIERKLQNKMNLKTFTESMLPAIETELQRFVAKLDEPRTHHFHEMLTYHMGWSGEGSGPEATGKRIRPLLVLLTYASASGLAGKTELESTGWKRALPAAASVELIHNFSLVHDDIQDGSDLRRGRLTVWKKWGMPQAINAGDALFILAHMALLETKEAFPLEIAMQSGSIINEACLALSSGQFMDISYEKRGDLVTEDYWPMISGKTAALLSACTQVGATLAGAEMPTQENYRCFGNYLGLAFQVQDDYLGIWGDSALTGKSTESDLVAGKKSLPVLFGLSKNGTFAKRWAEGPIHSDEVGFLSEELLVEGAKLFTQEAADHMTDLALQSLRAAEPQGEAGEALFELAQMLLIRKA